MERIFQSCIHYIMGKVISFHKGSPKTHGKGAYPSPWDFRRSRWNIPHFIQMLRAQSEKMEEEIYGQMPPHFILKGGVAYTIRAMWRFKETEEKMRDVYYLAGLMDCMINQVNPLLRTDILRDVYRKIFTMKRELNVNWYGPLDQVLLPIDPWLYNESEYRSALTNASTLKELYETIRENTDEMFDILSLAYIFYCPSVGG